MNIIEMRPAYQWTCDECGIDHFESAIVAEFSPEERIEQARDMGLIGEFDTEIPEDLTGDFVTYPNQVTCNNCGTTYDTDYMYTEEDN